jgi:hypothetical protein
MMTATTPLTDQQVTVVFARLLGMPPRATDLAVLQTLSPDLTAVDLTLYLWDHVLGEPDEPTLEDVAAAVREVLTQVNDDGTQMVDR